MKTLKNKTKTGVLAVILAILGVLVPGTGFAYEVTKTDDNTPDKPPIDGTLRYGLNVSTDAVITFASSLTGKTITLKAGQLVVDRTVTIQGPGADLLTVAGDKFRVFFIGGSDSAPSVTISGLTISKGKGKGEDLSGFGNDLNGGAILNTGTLTLSKCEVTSNKAVDGGGIYNSNGTLTITDTSVSYNEATGNGGGLYDGGTTTISRSAIFKNKGANGAGIQSNGTLNLINSTVSGNTTVGSGGGLNDEGGATVAIYDSTIAANTAGVGGGIATSPFGSSMQMSNTIVAGNTAATGPDVVHLAGPPISAADGRNIIGNGSGNIAGTFDGSDQVGVNPSIGPLQDNGGITPTMALLPDSPAINTGSNANVPPGVTTDQRNTYSRIIGGTVDVGAFEFIAPKALKSGALADLTPFQSPSLPADQADRLNTAISAIGASLDAVLWVAGSDMRLLRCGELVFEFEKLAVQKLLELINLNGVDPALAEAAQNAIDDMVLADEMLARIEIGDAVAANADPAKINSATQELSAGLVSLSQRKYRDAIDHYEKAWLEARKAKNKANDVDDDDDDCGTTRDQLEAIYFN